MTRFASVLWVLGVLASRVDADAPCADKQRRADEANLAAARVDAAVAAASERVEALKKRAAADAQARQEFIDASRQLTDLQNRQMQVREDASRAAAETQHCENEIDRARRNTEDAESARAEQKKKADEAEAARQAVIQAAAHNNEIMTNPDFVRAGLSAWVCIDEIMRRSALEKIQDEKKYSAIGGVQDNAKLYDLQNEVRTWDRAKATHLNALKTMKVTAMACKDFIVSRTATCVLNRDENDAVDGPCLEGKLDGPVEAALIVMHMIRLADPDE